jgi:mannan endo-1,4-beta-mannosidase
VTVSVAGQTGGHVTRPSYNTGNGFFVLDGKLYDANGNEFRIRGVDRTHYDSPSQPGISNSGANAVRMFLYTLGSGMAGKYAHVIQTQHIDYDEVPIPTLSLFPDGTKISCNESTGELASGVAWWVANAPTFTQFNRYMMINIANEWGPSNSATWASAYESAIASLRAAGYLGTLVIDAGGCGQDVADLLNYSTAVFNSDPQQNILFSLHIYGNIPTADVAADLAKLASLSQSAGMAFVVGEFGPGRDIGPSPTETTPGQIITAAEANGIGWMGWAWDDNDLPNGASDNNWFSMTLKGPGYYTKASDLTEYGQDVVLNPTYGISVLARPATSF